MANFKRRKSRRKVRCILCTDGRDGNANTGTGRRSKVGLEKKTKAQRKRDAERQAFLEDIFRIDE